jgi:hypothetical protein
MERRPAQTRGPTLSSQKSTLTETGSLASTTSETGNTITGSYTQNASDTMTTADIDVYSNAADSVTVTENSSQTSATVQTGNSITSVYTTVTNSFGQSYSMTETSSDFVLTEQLPSMFLRYALSKKRAGKRREWDESRKTSPSLPIFRLICGEFGR